MSLSSVQDKKLSKIVVSMIRKYYNHKLQTTPWHRQPPYKKDIGIPKI